MIFLEKCKAKVLARDTLSPSEARSLYDEPLEPLCHAANDIRQVLCGNAFDLCAIINAKSGRCSEDCKYCAQSVHYHTVCQEYPFLASEQIVHQARRLAEQGVLRYSLVTSGRTLNHGELEEVCQAVQAIKKSVPIRVCGSFGLLVKEQCSQLLAAGLERIHNNLETSERNFPNVCTTHGYHDKILTIQAAQGAGMEVCSGGIFGMGESVEDRIDLAFSLKKLGVRSVPMNLLNPVKGTPYETIVPLESEEFRRIVAVYRFLLPDAWLRLAGGRGLLKDKGRACFRSGANAAITGDMLTTAGISVETDKRMLEELGFEVNGFHE